MRDSLGAVFIGASCLCSSAGMEWWSLVGGALITAWAFLCQPASS